ncbi:MAG: hypothetical protein ACHP83_11990 [Burkholderiales bacterium]|jgi:hypothetical protein
MVLATGVRLALVLLAWGTCAVAHADPGYYVVTVYDNAGQRGIDLRYWTVKHPNSPEVAWPEIGFSYGVNTRWTSELFASFIGSSQMATRLSTWNWQNDVLLTQGEWPLDVAVHTNMARIANSDGAYALEIGPVLQTDIERTQLNGNVFFERGYAGAYPQQTQMKYQWQVRYRWRPPLHFGLQGFGELGPWDHWAPRDEQSHRAGPAVFGTVPFGERQALHWQGAYLVGSIYGRHGDMLTLRALYTF